MSTLAGTTDPTVNEYGAEEHPSWITLRAANISSTPGRRLFQSEVTHGHYIQITVERCSRKRELNHDWVHNVKQIAEFSMSAAQWGAFVSSFGSGSGVPATLDFLLGEGNVPEAPFESRIAESVSEVKGSVAKVVSKIAEAQAAVNEAFARSAGRKEMAKLLSHLDAMIENAPGNSGFAAKSLSEHVENTVAKARADVEAMVLHAIANNAELGAGLEVPIFGLGGGDVIDVDSTE